MKEGWLDGCAILDQSLRVLLWYTAEDHHVYHNGRITEQKINVVASKFLAQ